jgi:hypothetical protein
MQLLRQSNFNIAISIIITPIIQKLLNRHLSIKINPMSLHNKVGISQFRDIFKYHLKYVRTFSCLGFPLYNFPLYKIPCHNIVTLIYKILLFLKTMWLALIVLLKYLLLILFTYSSEEVITTTGCVYYG